MSDRKDGAEFKMRELDRALIERIVDAELSMPPYDPEEIEGPTLIWDTLAWKAKEANRAKYGRRVRPPMAEKLPLPFEYLLAAAHVIEGRPELRRVIEKELEFLNSPQLAEAGGDASLVVAKYGMGYGIPDYELWMGAVRGSYVGYFEETYVWSLPEGRRFRGFVAAAFHLSWEHGYVGEVGEEEWLRRDWAEFEHFDECYG